MSELAQVVPANLLNDVMSLPVEARAALLDSLIESMEPEPEIDVQLAWREEIDRRIRQIDSGAVDLIPWSDARRALRARLPR